MKLDSSTETENLRCTKMIFDSDPAWRVWHKEHLKRLQDGVLRGAPKQALELAASVTPEMRGTLAVSLWQSNVPPSAYRVFLDEVWSKYHGAVIDHVRSRKRLIQMFLHADFSLPTDWPDQITLWHGANKISPLKAAKGYSWTTSKDVACWFAMRFDSDPSTCMVLKTTVSKSQIVYFSDDRSESEVLLIRPPRPKSVAMDGNLSAWQQCADRHAAFIKNACAE